VPKGTHKKAENVNVKFDDVKGCDEVLNELMEVVDFLKDPQKYAKVGATLPRGVLLTGPPGTGKTLLARAVAGEAGVPFYYTSGSSFDEMFVGVGPKRVRELFETAKAEHTACIIFIDEIDAMGAARTSSSLLRSRETLNALLTEMDGFDQTSGIIVMAATNLPQSLDPALLRPGRFDRQLAVPAPDIKGRVAILDLYLSRKSDLARRQQHHAGAPHARHDRRRSAERRQRRRAQGGGAQLARHHAGAARGGDRRHPHGRHPPLGRRHHAPGRVLQHRRARERPRARRLLHARRQPAAQDVDFAARPGARRHVHAAGARRLLADQAPAARAARRAHGRPRRRGAALRHRRRDDRRRVRFSAGDAPRHRHGHQVRHERRSARCSSRATTASCRPRWPRRSRAFSTSATSTQQLLLKTHENELRRLTAELLDHEELSGEEIAAICSGKTLPPLPPSIGRYTGRNLADANKAPVPTPAL
jgi:hypothetical protein